MSRLPARRASATLVPSGSEKPSPASALRVSPKAPIPIPIRPQAIAIAIRRALALWSVASIGGP
jgi:hypothetical protein